MIEIRKDMINRKTLMFLKNSVKAESKNTYSIHRVFDEYILEENPKIDLMKGIIYLSMLCINNGTETFKLKN